MKETHREVLVKYKVTGFWEFNGTSFRIRLRLTLVKLLMLWWRLNPTKRIVVSIATRFYDPLGIVFPVTNF